MKRTFAYLAMVLFALSGCQKPGTWLTITNPLDTQRIEEKIVVTSEEAVKWIGGDIFSKIPLLTEADGTPIPTQADDLDGDGKWDEMIALVDIGPKEKKDFRLVLQSESEYPDFKDRTNVRLGANEIGYPELTVADRLDGVTYHNHSLTGKAFQMEGPAWENDHVGFRNYLDQRNAMDIFGKLTNEMVLDSVGIKSRGSYHEPDDWGMDILNVGKSLGAGSIGYYYKDSIYRVGDNGKGTYELVVDGNFRSIFHLNFSLWKMGDQLMDIVHQIEIQAGTYYYESAVTYTGIDKLPDLVTGIVNIDSDQLYTEELNKQFTALFTLDTQALDSTILCMALMVPSDQLIEYGATKDSGEGIVKTYFVRLKTEMGIPVKYRFYSFWERENPKWTDPKEIVKVLKQDADQLASPLGVELKSK